MLRARRRAVEPASVATSQELLRAALQRSARRNARVATARLVWRWLLWGLGHAGRLGGIALLVIAPFAGGWYLWQQRGTDDRVVASAQAPAPAVIAPRSAPSAAALPGLASDTSTAPAPETVSGPAAGAGVTADTAAAGMRLRLDESVTPPGPAPAAQSDTNSNPRGPATP